MDGLRWRIWRPRSSSFSEQIAELKGTDILFVPAGGGILRIFRTSLLFAINYNRASSSRCIFRRYIVCPKNTKPKTWFVSSPVLNIGDNQISVTKDNLPRLDADVHS